MSSIVLGCESLYVLGGEVIEATEVNFLGARLKGIGFRCVVGSIALSVLLRLLWGELWRFQGMGKTNS